MKKKWLVGSVLLWLVVPCAAILSAQRVTYINPGAAVFRFDYEVGVVGDSWIVTSRWTENDPFNAGIRIGRSGASIEEIKQMVRDANPVRIDTVYIIAGIANTAGHGISREDTMAEMPTLIELCRKKFSPRTIIAYDPSVMWQLLANPEYCYNAFHINDLGYEKLKQSKPLTFEEV